MYLDQIIELERVNGQCGGAPEARVVDRLASMTSVGMALALIAFAVRDGTIIRVRCRRL
jgi:hypothetical protein